MKYVCINICICVFVYMDIFIGYKNIWQEVNVYINKID